jgi:dienelactone hydrolase
MKAMLPLFLILLLAGNAAAALKTELIEYRHGNAVLQGYLAYDTSFKGKRPAVLVVHEWWGLNPYVQKRAEQLAKLGYIAFALDMYGKGITANNPVQAADLVTPFKKDRNLLRARAQAGLDQLMLHKLTDPRRVAAIGYCFGGMTVLELARGGAEVSGVVSFHGNLDTPNPAEARNIKGKVLVLHGADDPFVPAEQVAAFEDEMRKGGVDWQLNKYGRAVHSFTNPDADGYNLKGAAYNRKADLRSWEAMKVFFREIFK